MKANGNEQTIYTRETATLAVIRTHLLACAGSFIPPLHETVNIVAYASKIRSHAVTFEGWRDGVLVGLVAGYFNDPLGKTAFITNVSVLPGFTGLGIAGLLLKDSMLFARTRRFPTLRLEVNESNERAVTFYVRHGFVVTGRKLTDERTLVMDTNLNPGAVL
ncbi:MAG: GNAT family N-acetyltransferase [Planctomycetota bacterium]